MMQSLFSVLRPHPIFFSVIILLLTVFLPHVHASSQELQGAHAQIHTDRSFDVGLRFYTGGSDPQMRVYIFSIAKGSSPNVSSVDPIALWMTGSPAENVNSQNDTLLSANCAASTPVYDPMGALQSTPYTCGVGGRNREPSNTTCAYGDLTGVTGALPPPGTFALMAYHPFATLSGPRSIMGLGVQLLSGTKPVTRLGCGAIQPLHTSLFPEPSSTQYSVLNYAYYQKGLQDSYEQESRSKFILNIVLILALRNIYHALSLSVKKRHRTKPQFWIITLAVTCQILIHLPAWAGSVWPSAAISCLTADTIGFAAGYTTTFCITTVLLLRAYFANRKSPIILGVGASLLAILLINMCVTAASHTIPISPSIDCLAPFRYFDVSPAVLWIKIVTICVANILLSGCFLFQVFRQRLRTPNLIYKTLMKDGILYCVCVSISNILFPLLFVAHALQEQSFSFWSLDYMIATTLLVEQIRHQHRLLTDPRLSQYTVTTSDQISSISKVDAPPMSYSTLDPLSYSFYADSILSPYGNAKGGLRVTNGDTDGTLTREPSFTGRNRIPGPQDISHSETLSTVTPDLPLPIPAAFRDRSSLDTLSPTPLPHTPALCSSQASPGLNQNRSPLASPESFLRHPLATSVEPCRVSDDSISQDEEGNRLGYAAFRMSKASLGRERARGRISSSGLSQNSLDSHVSRSSWNSSDDEEEVTNTGKLSYVTAGSQARPGSPISESSAYTTPEQPTFQDSLRDTGQDSERMREARHSQRSLTSAHSAGSRSRGLIKMEGTWFDIHDEVEGDPSAVQVLPHTPRGPDTQFPPHQLLRKVKELFFTVELFDMDVLYNAD
ncbi:hypothetical protein BJ684DRAFT_14813 [Piptocephalis cylindrospora]|uniref:Uncharacterized protein n=1 Tax=Piptocephalis cylindrospora TaxID=1907219 RepID=A0A4P9Y761_9FUNG|nr:hypothetical protein BJ684DRAFT_14813 [Piptocephalis cylindrospora]|eukprot:RKP14885.1 hypothetical protein BJ684DRAFT_14813 [Piptocephalis cylindrospora]